MVNASRGTGRGRWLARLVVLVGAPLALAACTPAILVPVALYAGDKAVKYMTGEGMTAHALSAIGAGRSNPRVKAAAPAKVAFVQAAAPTTLAKVKAPEKEPVVTRTAILADDAVCGMEAARAEARYHIPKHLLSRISLVESGRPDPISPDPTSADPTSQDRVAWPWTVTARGVGQHFPTKATAIAAVKALRGQGIANIDVGCMQVNLEAHPAAFSSMEQAFDPKDNVAYAARFLVALHAQTGDWNTAAGYYHSQTPKLTQAYMRALKLKGVKPTTTRVSTSHPTLWDAYAWHLKQIKEYQQGGSPIASSE